MWQKLFSRTPQAEKRPAFITVVSGLPRSGTSMMMKMLAEGGLSIVTDQVRSADDDNPNGYFEFEPVKQLVARQGDLLAGQQGKAVKVISNLLEYLPAQYSYKIIFMERALGEVLASQKKMLAHRNETSPISDEEMRAQFEEHLKAIKYWLARQPNMEPLYVDYSKMVFDPQAYSQKIAKFLALPLDVDKMQAVPAQSLYRNR